MSDGFVTNISTDRRAITEKLQMEGLPIVIREDATDIWENRCQVFLQYTWITKKSMCLIPSMPCQRHFIRNFILTPDSLHVTALSY